MLWAAKAVALREALQPSFKVYAQAVADNANVLAETLLDGGLDIVSGGTDTHLVLVDLRPMGLTGNITEQSLERAGADLQQERGTVRSGKAGRHVRCPVGQPGCDVARLRYR